MEEIRKMPEFLKEIGRGKKGSQDLTYEEALSAAEYLSAMDATPTQIGAFLMAERVKGESVDELLAFTHAYQKHLLYHDSPWKPGLDSVGAFDGRGRSFASTIASSFILAALGLPVLLQGSKKSLPPKYGITTYEILREMNLALPEEPRLQKEAYRQLDIGYAETEDFCPPLKFIRNSRDEIGVRTLFNTVEKVLGVARNPYLVMGFFHGSRLEKHASFVHCLGYRRALVVQGIDGSEDVAIHRRSMAALVQPKGVEVFSLDPHQYGLNHHYRKEQLPAKEQAGISLSILRGEKHLYQDTVLFNAALRLWLCGRAENIEEGLTLSRLCLQSGAAYDKYKESEEWLLDHVKAQKLNFSR